MVIEAGSGCFWQGRGVSGVTIVFRGHTSICLLLFGFFLFMGISLVAEKGGWRGRLALGKGHLWCYLLLEQCIRIHDLDFFRLMDCYFSGSIGFDRELTKYVMHLVK